MTDTTTRDLADALEELRTGFESRIAALESRIANSRQGEEPAHKRSFSEITLAEINAMKADVKAFIIKPPRPTLSEISEFFWQTYHIGQADAEGEITPITKATATKLLRLTESKSLWDRLSYRA